MRLIAFVLPSQLHDCGIETGYGNGYVAIPKEHPCFGKDYDDSYLDSIDVHGGLTFAGTFRAGVSIPKEAEGKWIFGFDTAHGGDSRRNWPDENSVMQETIRLKEQLEKLSGKETIHFTRE